MMNLRDTDIADASKYRLIGRSVLAYRFIAPHDETIYIGDIKKIVDRTKGSTFFAKVTDLVHDANFADPKWDTRAYAEQFYGLGEDVFIAVDAVPLGFVDKDGRFHKPRTIPSKFSTVEDPTAADFRFLTEQMGEIEVGLMRSGQDVIKDVAVRIPAKVLPQHMGVFATTGMGKSNFMKTFCASCMKEQKFGLLIVDPHGEYVSGGKSSTGDPTKGLAHYTNGKDGLSIFTIRGEADRKKYAMNRLWLEYDDFRIGDLSILYDLTSAQFDIVEAFSRVNGSDVIRFFEEVDPEIFPVKDPLAAGIKEGSLAWMIRNSMAGPVRVIQRHIENITKANSAFFRQSGSTVQEIITNLHKNKVVLIDIPDMGERSELFVLSIITRMIMEKHRSEARGFGIDEKQEASHQVLITIEEAQRVLAAGGASTQMFRECAMEGRKFGVGLCVITQQPKNVDPKVLAQINTFVVMGLGDRGDREIIMGSAKQDLSKMEIEIQTLDRGEAIISTIGIPFPVSTRIHRYEDYIATLNSRKKKDIREGLSGGFS
ncbi:MULTISPECIES: ATP-binding protein [unclassified Methanoregula]|uniref:ATP-binding protein n=1 Tax=unclassified Methanoregula TaxID=2649730 RepID=UPI0009C8DB30|nr:MULTISPECIES: ATP-binding protein [unclassified Methanoregula]OPX65379.1 MAG: AAA-like domain protein [Methanoregula sp. PtaB.Bin085]OPY32288.1 MAG: AAA-like domain protein [Methanoregula sp. PtaU1.Bin006]